jgi:hypothetical protein
LDYGRTLLAWDLGDGEVLFPDYLNCDKAADNATASNQSPQIGGLRNVSDPGW